MTFPGTNGFKSSTQELVDAQALVWNNIFNHINSMSLKCAIQLGIQDAIHKHGKPMTLSELVDALHVNKAKSRGLYRLMRILVHSKFFEKNEEGGYSLTRASRLLLKDEPLSMAPFALALLDPVITDPFQYLSEWFQNELPTPFVTKNGMNAWEYTEIDPKWSQTYYDGLACDAPFVVSVLVKEYKHVFEGLRTMVDVGGGTGMVAKGIADAFPSLKCIVLDLPHAVDGLQEYENLSFMGGDMFDSIPCADAVFLKWNLTMWNDEEGVKLLENCKKAITSPSSKNGRVIIVEMILDDEGKDEHKATETHLFFDLNLMTRHAGGGERTKDEWEKLFFAAGFTSYKINPILGLRSVIEVFP